MEIFCLTEPRNFVEEPFCVAENFWYRKMSRRERERGGHHDFPSKICCLTVPSKFVGETCVSEIFWYRKMLRIREREGGHHDFLSKFCCLTVQKTKTFVGETCVSESFWYRKMLRIREREGASRLSIETLLSHSTEKLRRGNLCFRKVLVSQNFMDEKGS